MATAVKRRMRRGATLLEIMISVALVGMLMAIFANIVTQYTRVVRHQDRKDRSVANIKMALDVVTTEIESAQEVLIPMTDGGVATMVRFTRFVPSFFREKFDTKQVMTVTYYLDSGTLYRSIYHEDKTTVYPVAHEVLGFSVKRNFSRLYTVSVSLEDGYRIYSIDGRACLKMNI